MSAWIGTLSDYKQTGVAGRWRTTSKSASRSTFDNSVKWEFEDNTEDVGEYLRASASSSNTVSITDETMRSFFQCEFVDI